MWYGSYILSALACGVCYWIWQSSQTKQRHRLIIEREGCKPPKCLPNKLFPPFGLDKLGNVIEAEKARAYPLLMLNDHEKFGDTYAQWGGPMYTVITRDPLNVRALLSRQFKDFEVGAGRHGCILPLLGKGIFTSDGPEWEASRKVLAPMIQRPTLPDVNLIEKHFQRLQTRIETMLKDNTGFIDLKEPLFDLSLDLTTEFLLGDLDGEDGETSTWGDAFAKEFNTAFRWISKRERLKAFYWMADSMEFRQSCKAARNVVDQVIERSIKALQEHESNAETYIALEPLLRDSADVGAIRNQFLNLLLAGRDTSGSLLCWVFYALAREPELVTALKAEMNNVLGGGTPMPQRGQLEREMPLLDAFITETLRVFPPVPINGRFSVRDTSLPHGGGEDGQSPMLIPKGTLIAFSSFATQHNKKLYGADADRFRVDRWKGGIAKDRRGIGNGDWSYAPFIGGPRKCLGERFAVIQAKFLTCRILQHFDNLVACDEQGAAINVKPDGTWVEDVKYHVGLTMQPDEAVWVRLSPAA